jgi:hypothetical protein
VLFIHQIFLLKFSAIVFRYLDIEAGELKFYHIEYLKNKQIFQKKIKIIEKIFFQKR